LCSIFELPAHVALFEFAQSINQAHSMLHLYVTVMSHADPTGRVLVTGAAGFVGSHLCRRLLSDGAQVRALDNLSTGAKANIEDIMDSERFEFTLGDVLEQKQVENLVDGCTAVFHLAANPEVRAALSDGEIDFQQNLRSTHVLLEALRAKSWRGTLIFTSTSTVYGDAAQLPTPENYGPLMPISMYGATKLGCEALITAYSHLLGLKALIFRFANVVGPRGGHGVIHDFLTKLSQNPTRLEVLGDGTQTKSYIYVDDCVDAFIRATRQGNENPGIYNVGTDDQTDVKTIASIVIQEMGLRDVQISFKPGPEGRGWPGDVKQMLLDISKLRTLGWSPRFRSTDAVRKATEQLVKEFEHG
jgi:UDP-glucose 4-epimerase